MEKEMDKNTYVLENGEEFGTVKIANDVVSMIAGLAATEIDGVSGIVGHTANELMSKVGMKKQIKGVKVDIIEKTVSVEIAVYLNYGFNIPTTCKKVQEKVKVAVENMTGLSCTDVNIRIAGINMKNDKKN